MSHMLKVLFAVLGTIATGTALAVSTAGIPLPLNPIVCTTACNVSGLRVGQSAMIVKIANTNRANNATPALDPDLQFTGVPNGTYILDGQLQASLGAGGILWLFANASDSQPSGLTGLTFFTSGSCGATTSPVTLLASCINGTAGSNYYDSNGSLLVSAANWATIGIWWAQDISNAANTTVGLQSYLRLTRVN